MNSWLIYNRGLHPLTFNLIEGDVWRVVGGVNIQTMKETAMILEGTHDFWAFRKTRGPEAGNRWRSEFLHPLSYIVVQ